MSDAYIDNCCTCNVPDGLYSLTVYYSWPTKQAWIEGGCSGAEPVAGASDFADMYTAAAAIANACTLESPPIAWAAAASTALPCDVIPPPVAGIYAIDYTPTYDPIGNTFGSQWVSGNAFAGWIQTDYFDTPCAFGAKNYCTSALFDLNPGCTPDNIEGVSVTRVWFKPNASIGTYCLSEAIRDCVGLGCAISSGPTSCGSHAGVSAHTVIDLAVSTQFPTAPGGPFGYRMFSGPTGYAPCRDCACP